EFRHVLFRSSQLVQTNTLLDSQTTNTHPSPQPTQGHVHWGHPHQISPPHNPNRPRTEPVFVLVRPGRNPVLRTMFPAGQRDITLDQTRSVVQLEPGPHACDNRHRRRPATTPARTPPSQPTTNTDRDRHPTPRPVPGPNPCSSWSDPAETLFFEPCSRRGNEI